MIASAVSAGCRPPRSSPTGPRSRASSSSPTPAARSRSRRSPCVFFDADRADVPAAAAECLDDRRLVELHVVGQDGDRVVRPEPDLVGHLVRPADDQPVDPVGREALRGRERGAAVDDDRLVARARGARPDERPGDLDRAHDDEPGPDRERLDEDLAAARSSTVRDVPRSSASRAAATSAASAAAEPSDPRASRRPRRRSAAAAASPSPGS